MLCVSIELCFPLGGQQIGAHKQASVGQCLPRNIFENCVVGYLAGDPGHGGEHGLFAKFGFHLKMLLHHLVAQPLGKGGSLLIGLHPLELGWLHGVTEMC